MAEETKQETTEVKQTINKPMNKYEGKFQKNTSKVRQRRDRNGKDKREKGDDEFDHKIINIRRVVRMFKGGRRMRLSVFVVVGDRKGRVGLGLGKGTDVKSASDKAISKAKKNLIFVQLKGNTIPHEVKVKLGAAKIMMKPAAPGTGIVAGSSMRMVAEVAGIKDVLGKIFGTNNSINNAYATVEALSELRSTRL